MIACLDVDYRDPGAVAACVLFRDWPDERPTAEVVVPIESVEPYQPGQFYRRELPCLLAALGRLDHPPDVVVIDGYVWLSDEGEPGLGARLYEAMGRRAAVIGVAKTRFLRARGAAEVRRGESRSPLFVTSAGIDPAEAARHLGEMHGPHRIPTLLRRVDRLCRDGPSPGAHPD